jgi:hypothetical protein
MPATGPFSTDSWHVSVHLSIAFSMCVRWGNGIGCCADTCIPKKSRMAAELELWAVVKILAGGGAGAQAGAHAAIPRMTPRVTSQRARIRPDYFFAMLCR